MAEPLVRQSSSGVQNLPCWSWGKPVLRPTMSDPRGEKRDLEHAPLRPRRRSADSLHASCPDEATD